MFLFFFLPNDKQSVSDGKNMLNNFSYDCECVGVESVLSVWNGAQKSNKMQMKRRIYNTNTHIEEKHANRSNYRNRLTL